MAKHDSIFKTIEEMQAEKADWVERTKRLNNFEGIKNTLTKLYTSSGHFIFELLQNAEDVFATSVTFKLESDRLVFEHNGTRLFNINDVDSITNIGDSTKEDNGNTIGKFGIGFKSVFEYTASPEIHSGEYHFVIEDLFVPKIISPILEKNTGATLIILPFNTPLKDKSECYDEINNSLNELKATDLLFLQNITDINCIIGSRTIAIKRIDSYNDDNCPSNVCRLVKRVKEGNILQILEKNALETQRFYKRFFKTITVLGEDKKEKNVSVGVAFGVECSKDDKKWRIKPIFKNNTTVPDGRVFAYFPCNAEERRFCFHIHAPFALTVDREKLRDDEANKSVIDEIGTLVCDSIKELKDDGLVDLDLYKALPNKIDDENLGKFEMIRTKLIDCFLNNPYVLMSDGSYQDGKNRLIGFHNIQQLLSNEDLSMLYGSPQKSYWVKNPMQNRRDYNFFVSLEVREYGIVDFLKEILTLKSKSAEVYFNVLNVFENREIDWYIKLYSLMANGWNAISRSQLQYPITLLKLCYCNDKKLHEFNECYLADSVSSMESSKIFCVNSECLSSKKTDVDLISFFRNRLGIKEYKLSDMIESLCEDFENKQNKSLSDSIAFYKMYQKDNSIIDVLKKYKILCSDTDTWGAPDWFYLPEEFDVSVSNISIYYDFYNSKINTPETKLNSIYYYSRKPKEHPFHKLSLEYKTQFDTENELIGFIAFLERLGVKTSLCLWWTSCRTSPIWYQIRANAEQFFGGNANETDEDYEVKYLDSFLKRTPNEAVFELILTFLKDTPARFRTCRYSPAKKYKPKIYSSHITVDLTNAAWILQVSDESTTFVKPEDAYLSRIPTQYRMQIESSNIKDWLLCMNFGKKEREQSERHKKENEILSSMGLDIGFIDIIRELKSKGVSDFELQEIMLAIKDDLQSKMAEGFFSRDNVDDSRIRIKSVENYNCADDIEYEKRIRSVRIGSKQKELAEPFLRGICIDSDNRMHCQICKGLMPFKDKDNKDYFETVQLFHADLIKKDVKENYVALCPVCSAKMKVYYQHDKEKKKDLYNRIRYGQSNITVFKVSLDREESIVFSERHIIALKQLIEESANYKKEDNVPKDEEDSVFENSNSETSVSYGAVPSMLQSLLSTNSTHGVVPDFYENSFEKQNSNSSSSSASRLEQAEVNKVSDQSIKEDLAQISESDIKIEKKVLNAFIAQRSVSPVSGFLKFKTEDNIYILADEKGMENKSLPWANENVEITVYEESVRKINCNLTEKEEKIISNWSWEKIT